MSSSLSLLKHRLCNFCRMYPAKYLLVAFHVCYSLSCFSCNVRCFSDRNIDHCINSNLEQARPLLENFVIQELLDPRLKNCYSKQEVRNMLQCASLCIRRDPDSRPRMSQV